MKSSSARECFLKYLEKVHSSENYYFIVDVEKFKNLRTDKSRFIQYEKIKKLYINKLSIHEINISALERKQFLKSSKEVSITDCPSTLFQHLEIVTKFMIKMDNFETFLSSNLFSNFCIDRTSVELLKYGSLKKDKLKKKEFNEIYS